MSRDEQFYEVRQFVDSFSFQGDTLLPMTVGLEIDGIWRAVHQVCEDCDTSFRHTIVTGDQGGGR